MSRAFWIPGVTLLLAATVLNFLVAVGLPFLTALDIARVHFSSGTATAASGQDGLSQLRIGTWGYCAYEAASGDRTCTSANNAYAFTVHGTNNEETVGPSWTRGLAVHPVAAGVSFLALVFSLSTHLTAMLFASLTAFLAALITLIAFAIDIALFAFTHHQMGKVQGVKKNVNTAPGFWLTFVAFILLCISGCIVIFGRRRDRMYGSTTYPTTTTTKPGFFSRFRRRY
ncbi:hypothetical protein PUNSTDRAFT_106723 [Punctularia strigosozonata HHB-11173 SS5]|uniref:uncharacterized protein n=1 Tax=Punctularia strigosozonata (strain HHB-11173) TaxID=741275 RepID=UPI0004416317|nr:uncharacterized protein PUNSTDRAFT_106723 [Punctularia strigosozonata HHB-11173 SS5]EIN05736.1 hypothetical protein PUNSTDRAFT_106723 [Punctularia strigosozonata HHB-11173 SS5]